MKPKIMMILMMLGVSIGFILAGATSAVAQAGEKIVFSSNRDGNAEIYVMNADGSNPTRLTTNPADDVEPSFSPDGSQIVFRSTRDGNFEIHVMNADGSNQINLTNNPASDAQPSFSPDGSQIVFRSFRNSNFEIYVMNADGSNQINLTNNPAFDVEPSFSPDGSQIVFRSARDGNSEIYVMNVDGSNQINLSNNAAVDAEPTFSPDGSKIAFRSDRDGNAEIYVMNVDGSNQTRLTNNPAIDAEPSWVAQADTDGDGVPDFRDNCPSTPNPEKIAFVSDRDGNFEIYVMNSDGSNQMRLTNNPAFDVEPAFSPDGSRIAFRSLRDGNDEIYVMNSDGSNPMRLTNNSATDFQPTFSPDGSRIAFTSFRDGNTEIYVMNADGSNQINLTNNPANDVEPSFSPDGSRIAFRSNRAGNNEIYVMNSDGSNQINLTNNPAVDAEPSFSPDGSRIVFRSNRDGNPEIYLMNADGSNPMRLTTNAAFDVEPSFSPDGSQIAFTSQRDGNNEIYLMNADGSNPMRLTTNSAGDANPSWGAQADSDDDGIGDACENTAPMITAQPVSQARDSSSNQLIAVVSDTEDAAGDLIVTIDGASTVNGVTLSNLAVDSTGNVTADVAATCSASDASFTLKVTDSGNLMATAMLNVTVTNETTPPVINPLANIVVTLPANTNATSVAVTFPLPTATDNCPGAVMVTTNPVSGSQFNVGTTTVNVTATDAVGNQAMSSFTVTVRYRFRFNTFFSPFREDRLNLVDAGSDVSVIFSLSGFKGTSIYRAVPASQRINCADRTPIGAIQPIMTTVNYDPIYNAGFDVYSTTWNTRAVWAGTCRRLFLYLNDGTTQTLDFRFR